jgi:hypothetical protein
MSDDMKILPLASVYAAVSADGQVAGVELTFDAEMVPNPLAASQSLDLMRNALSNSWWVANTVGRVGVPPDQTGEETQDESEPPDEEQSETTQPDWG